MFPFARVGLVVGVSIKEIDKSFSRHDRKQVVIFHVNDSLLEIEPFGADPHARLCGRGTGAIRAPIPIAIVIRLSARRGVHHVPDVPHTCDSDR